MANYMTTSLEATKYLCGLIRDLATVSEGIDDINLRSDGTFSSVMIDTLIKKCLEDSNEYTEKLVANLSRLELKLVTSESEITESNILYLFKPDGATSYNQYVVIEGNKVLLGTCDINMADYIKVADVAKDYATKVELKAVTDKIGTTTLTTTDTTITGAIEEVKGIAEGKAESLTFNSDDFSVDTATSAVKLTPERRVFNGSKADWDLLSVAEKTQYGATAFTDDEGGETSTLVDVVESGNMHAVTSNAVANFAFDKSKIRTGIVRGGSADNDDWYATFDTPFADSKYTVIATPFSESGAPYCPNGWYVVALLATGFRLYCSGHAPRNGFQYIAIHN